MITVKEIARMSGVSPSTVSNIINGKGNMTKETKERVLKVIEETGYKPNFYAQSMRLTNNKLICVIAEELCQFSGPPIVEAIMDYAEENGYRVMLINMGMYYKWKNHNKQVGDDSFLLDYAKPAFEEAMLLRPAGIIYLAAHGRILNCAPSDLNIPLVFSYAAYRDDKYKSVIIDDVRASKEVVNYLIKKGHRKIGVIAGTGDNLHSIKRLEGYKEALCDNAISFDESLIFKGDWERESGYEGAKMLDKENVTAVWCMNDLMAVGAYDYFRECGKAVGKDISIIGFDNREISEIMYPELSTIEIPLEKIGLESAKLMIKEIENAEFRDTVQPPELVPCKMIERSSVQV